MTVSPSEGSPEPELQTTEITEIDELIALILRYSESAEQTEPWIIDLKNFAASHQEALSMVREAFRAPTQTILDGADESLGVAKKNSGLLFVKEYFRGLAIGGSPDTTPLESAVRVVARASEDFDQELKVLFPLKIERDRYSADDLAKIVLDAKDLNEQDALRPLGKLTSQYDLLCGEIQELLKSSKVKKAMSTSRGGSISKKMGDERMKELKDLGLAGAVLLGATVLGNILSRSKK